VDRHTGDNSRDCNNALTLLSAWLVHAGFWQFSSLAISHAIQEQATKTQRDLNRVTLQGMPWEELIGQEITAQHSRKRPGGERRIYPAKPPFLDAAVDQLLNQTDKPADELIVERIGQGMVFQRAVIVKSQENRIEGLGKPPRNQPQSVLYRDTATFCSIDKARQALVLQLVSQDRRKEILLARKMAKNKRFVHTGSARDARRRRALEAPRRKKLPRRRYNPLTARKGGSLSCRLAHPR
jgi:hypothetical protein